jgi:hypothetical protein
VTVVFVMAPALPVAAEHSSARNTPAPFVLALVSRAGQVGEVTACPVVVVTTGTLPHSLSTSQSMPMLPACTMDSRSMYDVLPLTAAGLAIWPDTLAVNVAPFSPPDGAAPAPMIPAVYQGVCGVPAACAVPEFFPTTVGAVIVP